jgi:hypothetical protein
MNRRNFLRQCVGGIATVAAVRTWPFRVYSFPSAPKTIDVLIDSREITTQYLLREYLALWPDGSLHKEIIMGKSQMEVMYEALTKASQRTEHMLQTYSGREANPRPGTHDIVRSEFVGEEKVLLIQKPDSLLRLGDWDANKLG